jgi:hypothetical protein
MKKQLWQDWLSLVLGIWLLVSPWVIGREASDSLISNAYVMGLALTAFAVTALVAFRLWEEWVTLILGAWLLVSPWFLGFNAVSLLTWNTVLIGIVVTVCAAWAITEVEDRGKPITK